MSLVFHPDSLSVTTEPSLPIAHGFQIILEDNTPFTARLIEASVDEALSPRSLVFEIQGKIQNVPIAGRTLFNHLEIMEASTKEFPSSEPLWVYSHPEKGTFIPASLGEGEGVLIAKHFQKSGVRLGDQGYLAYYTLAGSAMQEQRIPVYVAGFYDPGMIPVGNKLVFVSPQVAAILSDFSTIADPMLGNGINVWLDDFNDAAPFKEALVHLLEREGLSQYWSVQSYHDYEFTRPILEQLRSDKNLFTLIALIILIVACSNIISMLILLVNDKRKEIGILQSMGASPFRIATIFGLCGFITGLISCAIGITAAIFTLKNLNSLISLLSFFQGRDAFQAAFYGTSLPNELSYPVLVLILGATLVISLLAGIIPAIKASKIRPAEILRSE
ncbi:MAG: ABC transporter permease [Chlamydiia bacterium]|nr:ABC transporter permease [Chlamydiia bacterium]